MEKSKWEKKPKKIDIWDKDKEFLDDWEYVPREDNEPIAYVLKTDSDDDKPIVIGAKEGNRKKAKWGLTSSEKEGQKIADA